MEEEVWQYATAVVNFCDTKTRDKHYRVVQTKGSGSAVMMLDSDGNLITDLTVSQAEALIRDGTVSGGMIPKVETCINAVLGGAEAAVIMDGRAPHALLVELFTEHGMGTFIKAG